MRNLFDLNAQCFNIDVIYLQNDLFSDLFSGISPTFWDVVQFRQCLRKMMPLNQYIEMRIIVAQYRFDQITQIMLIGFLKTGLVP